MPPKLNQPRQRHNRKLRHALEDPSFHGKKHHGRERHLLPDGDEDLGTRIDDPAYIGPLSGRSVRRPFLSCVADQRRGPSTPVPGWKVSNNPFQNPDVTSIAPYRILVSARKLAASLGELHGTPMWQVYLNRNLNKEPHYKCFKDMNELATAVSPTTKQCPAMHQKLAYHTRKGDITGEQACSIYSGVLRLILETLTEATSTQTHSHDTHEVMQSEVSAVNVPPSGVKSRTRDCYSTSSDLVKVLNQIWALQGQYNLNVSLVSKLQTDLKKAKVRVKKLNMMQKSHAAAIEKLTKMLADERSKSCDHEQETLKEAIKRLQEQLKEEKMAKQKLKLHHKEVIRELNEVRKVMTKALKDLEREKRARELIEDVCDELARECGEDKAELEELRGASANISEKAGKEQKMFQLPGVWQEETLQLKLEKVQSERNSMNLSLDKFEALLKGELSSEDDIQQNGARVPADVHVHDDAIFSQVLKNQIVRNFVANDAAGGSSQFHKWGVDGDKELISCLLNKESNAGKAVDKQWGQTIIQERKATKEYNAGKEGDKQRGQAANARNSKRGQEFNTPDNEGTVITPTQSGRKAVVDCGRIEGISQKCELRDWNIERGSLLEAKESAHNPLKSENEHFHGVLSSRIMQKLGQRQLHGHSSSFLRSMASNTKSI